MTSETTTPQPLDAWAMACAVLAGARKARRAAEEEREAALRAGGNHPFARGVTKAQVIAEAMIDAEKVLEADLGQVARTNSLPMPSRHSSGA